MAERKSFLLRLPPDLLEDLQLWARDEIRSINAQIEFLLRESVRRQRRERAASARKPPEAADGAATHSDPPPDPPPRPE